MVIGVRRGERALLKIKVEPGSQLFRNPKWFTKFLNPTTTYCKIGFITFMAKM